VTGAGRARAGRREAFGGDAGHGRGMKVAEALEVLRRARGPGRRGNAWPRAVGGFVGCPLGGPSGALARLGTGWHKPETCVKWTGYAAVMVLKL
jgi:hypothetical protein